jgi:hypothetical protein
MDLLVIDTDVALLGVTQVAVDTGGYILSGHSWYEGGFKFAQMTIAVPAEQYESSLARLRRLGLQVLRETSSGVDVSEEYVDLESRLRNAEAQADRLRAFLSDAENVQEAITVSQSLAEVEAEIETIKGRASYLAGRSAYSTISVALEPQRPTATPTLTPSATPTPTATPTSTATATATPWNPGRTFQQASGATVVMAQGTLDTLIWVLVVGSPIVAPLVAGLFLLRRRSARARK